MSWFSLENKEIKNKNKAENTMWFHLFCDYWFRIRDRGWYLMILWWDINPNLTFAWALLVLSSGNPFSASFDMGSPSYSNRTGSGTASCFHPQKNYPQTPRPFYLNSCNDCFQWHNKNDIVSYYLCWCLRLWFGFVVHSYLSIHRGSDCASLVCT